MKTSLFLGTALAAVLVTGMAGAAKKSYIAADMDGDKEKPKAVNSAVTGEARFTYDDVTKKLCGHITTKPLTFVATASHIHKGKADVAGDVAIALDGFTGELKVNQTLTADEAAALDTDVYVNVHSATNPDGEIRDQLILDGDDTAADEVCEGDEPAGDAGASSSSSSSGSTSSGDAGKTSTSATPASTDSGGCNTSGSSGTGTGLGIAAGLGLALSVLARKRKKA